MRNYFIRRVGHSIFIIAGLMGLLFFAINILGDPVQLLLDEEASEEAIDALRAKFGLDRPLYIRFADFYWDLIRGDFGQSIRHRIDAREMIFDRLPNTAVLAVIAWSLGALGIPLGMMAARRPRGIVDRVVNILSFAVISVPEFWLALMLILIVSVQLGLLPTSGFNGLGPAGWKFMILPALALCPRVMGRNAHCHSDGRRAIWVHEWLNDSGGHLWLAGDWAAADPGNHGPGLTGGYCLGVRDRVVCHAGEPGG